VVVKALYGLKSSGAAFRSKLAQDFRDLGYVASKADPDVYLKPRSKPDGSTYYECLLVYVADILCLSHAPELFMTKLGFIYTHKNGFQ
jgi:hypothetical protein